VLGSVVPGVGSGLISGAASFASPWNNEIAGIVVKCVAAVVPRARAHG
jgi:hypothetical protein